MTPRRASVSIIGANMYQREDKYAFVEEMFDSMEDHCDSMEDRYGTMEA
jgi:hypothetical protein